MTCNFRYKNQHALSFASITLGNNEPLRPNFIAYYTVAMNALDSVFVDLQTKVEHEQANTAIVSLLNTSLYTWTKLLP